MAAPVPWRGGEGRDVDIRILGPLEASADGNPLPVGGPRQRALLARLALSRGRAVPTGRLVDDLWGDAAPETAAKMVQIHVSALRKVLPADVLVTRPPGYLLDVPEDAVDLDRVERLAARGRAALEAGDPQTAAGTLREALAIWRGPALAEFAEPFAALEGPRLEERRLALLEACLEADLALGRHAELVPELEALVAEHPLRESPRGRLMLALYRAGRQAEALAAYQDARRALSDELGIEPSAALRDLERRILRQDPRLELAPAPTPGSGRAARATAAGRAAPLVGREEHLGRLAAALERARGRHRAVVLVSGEAGAGKTTLVDAFLERAGGRRGDLLVGRGQCVDQHGAREPYMPVLQALDRLCRSPGGEEVAALLVRRAPTWAVQMPALAEAAEAAQLRERVLGATRDRMLREMVEALAALADARPLALVMEDLHWSDPSSLDLLSALARDREPARLLLLGTLRPTEGDPSRALLADLVPRGLAEEVALEALAESHVAQYLAARLPGAGLPAGVPAALLERTGGNPLFLEKAVDAWVEHGKVHRAGGAWRLEADPSDLQRGVPSTVRQLIRQRLMGVAAEDRRLLEAASVAAPEFSSALVAAATERDPDEVDERLHALAAEGVLVAARGEEAWPDGTVAGRYGFTHDLCHEVLYEDLPPGRRARMHRAVGRRLEEGLGARATDVAGELASHFLRGGQPEEAVRHLSAAAAQAVERLAPREAVELISTALEAVERRVPGPERDAAELELQTMLGPALVAIRGWADPEVEAAFARARELADRLGMPDEAAWSAFKMATLHEVRGQYARAEEILRATLEAPERPLGAPALVDSYELLACSLFHQGAFARALASAERGLEAFDGVSANEYMACYGDNPGIACHTWAALSQWFLGRPDAALTTAERAVALAEEPGRRHGLATAMTHAAITAQLRGEPGLARRWADAAVAAARRGGFAYREAMGLVLRGWARAAEGEAAEGVAEVRQGLALSRATGARMDEAYFLGLLADALLRGGDAGAALAALDEAVAVVPRNGRFFFGAELHRLRGEALAARGEPEAGEAALRRALAVSRDQESPSLALRAALALGGLLRSAGRDEEARAVVAAAYDGFADGFGTPDLARATAFLHDPGAPGESLAASAVP